MRRMNQYVAVTAAEAAIPRDGVIKLHGEEAFEGMRKAGRLAAEILDALTSFVVPGISTQDIDDLVREMTLKGGGIPATLGYRGYTHSCCTSINHVICHGIPSDKKLRDGDIVNIDVTPIIDGWHGDTSRMFAVGEGVSILGNRLMRVTHECLWLGIAAVRPGAHLGDIGAAIQRHAEQNGFSVVREFCGHGIGRRFHEEPQVLHYGKPGTGIRLEPGMVFTIEPMINAGKAAISELPDGWTIVTKDRSLSAQWEHTVVVTSTGVEVLTLSAGAPPNPFPG